MATRTDIPLLRIVHDLMVNPQLRQRFNQNPNAVIKEYDLDGADEQQLETFLTMNPVDIGTKLEALVHNLRLKPGEFPAPSEDFFQEDGGGEPFYPDPKPGVFRIRPRRVRLAKAQQPFEFVVFGQSLIEGRCDLELLRVTPANPANVRLDLSQPVVIGTLRGSKMRTVVSELPTFPFAVGQQFQVIVRVAGTDYGPKNNLLLEIIQN